MLRKNDIYEREVWPRLRSQFLQSKNRIMFLHGIMGSELYDGKTDNTRWLDTGIWHEVDDLEYQRITPTGAIDVDNQLIYARSTVHPPFVSDPYENFLQQLSPGTFTYDWRESIPVEAQRLRLFLQSLPRDTSFNFVTHSMGGCVLISLLANTTEFDERIEKIIFCAPPFRGALRPLRVIEDGNGTPIDWIIRNNVLRQSAATMPALFQLLVAPLNFWPRELPTDTGSISLKYPVRTSESLYSPAVWSNRERMDLRADLLEFSFRYHKGNEGMLPRIMRRIGDKTYVVLGVNGKTPYCLTRASNNDWVLHKAPKPQDEQKVSNGDGTVLFQSSILPGLPNSRYFAEVPESQSNIHGEMMDRQNVINHIKGILSGSVPSAGVIQGYDSIVEGIDWTKEEHHTEDPGESEYLDYIERARRRSVTTSASWGDDLNPEDDALLFSRTREAAMRVLNGEDLRSESARLEQSVGFLERHIQALLLPALYS